MKVGERIRELRISRGLTQEELGSVLGVTKGAIQKYENGQIRNFKANTIKQLSNYFGVPPVNFIYDTDEIPDYSKPAIDTYLYTYFKNRAGRIVKVANMLNEDGLRKVENYVTDILEIEKYRKQKEEPSQ